MRRAFAPVRAGRFGVERVGLTAILALVLIAAQSPPVDSGAGKLRLPAERTFADHPDSPGPVVFNHATHVEFAGGSCLTCHPSPFSILGTHRPVSHAVMETGQACGLCHNGSDATAIDDSDACAHCHREGGSR